MSGQLPAVAQVRVEKYLGVAQNLGYHHGGPNRKDCKTLGSIVGFPYLGKPTIQAEPKV